MFYYIRYRICFKKELYINNFYNRFIIISYTLLISDIEINIKIYKQIKKEFNFH